MGYVVKCHKKTVFLLFSNFKINVCNVAIHIILELVCLVHGLECYWFIYMERKSGSKGTETVDKRIWLNKVWLQWFLFMHLLTGALCVLASCRLLLPFGLLGWVDPLNLWLITDSQSFLLGELFSLPAPAWPVKQSLSSVCKLNRSPFSSEQFSALTELLLRFKSGYISDTPSRSLPKPDLAQSPVSSRRFARRSDEGPWRTGVSTLRRGDVPWWPGELLRLNHCWIDEGILGLLSLAEGAEVFDGRGKSAPVGAQEAGWGEARETTLSEPGLLAGVSSTGM